MFNSLLSVHRSASAHRKEELSRLRAEALQACEVVQANLLSSVHMGVGALYRNQRLLAIEAETLAAHTQRFSAMSERLMKMSYQFNTAMRELGDVNNWALTIEKDMRWIEEKLVAAEKERDEVEAKEKQLEQQRLKEEADRRNSASTNTSQASSSASSSSSSTTTIASSHTNVPHPLHAQASAEELP